MSLYRVLLLTISFGFWKEREKAVFFFENSRHWTPPPATPSTEDAREWLASVESESSGMQMSVGAPAPPSGDLERIGNGRKENQRRLHKYANERVFIGMGPV